MHAPELSWPPAVQESGTDMRRHLLAVSEPAAVPKSLPLPMPLELMKVRTYAPVNRIPGREGERAGV